MRRTTLKILTVLLFILCISSFSAYAQVAENMQVYNRGEKVELSRPLIFDNDDYFIWAEDLSKINLEYKFEELSDGFSFSVYSRDLFGTENTLNIAATENILNIEGDEFGTVVQIKSYRYTNKMHSKKAISTNQNSSQLLDIPIGNFRSVIKEEGEYYISLKAIKLAISYEYTITDDKINLWITDENHTVINGTISLPEGETAGVGGEKVRVFIHEGEYPPIKNYTLEAFLIPEGKNSVSYFLESDIQKAYRYVMFDFDGDYKTVEDVYNASSDRGRLDITATPASKKSFRISFYLSGGLVAEEDIYAKVEFDRSAVYAGDEPIIKKGDWVGAVTINIDEDFAGIVSIFDVKGDSRVFPYGIYGLGELRFYPENAWIVPASRNNIEIELMTCYEISGKVIPADINTGYNVMVSGTTDNNEKLNLKCEVAEDFSFKVKVPATLYEYNLSVAYKPGAYCGYISEGVSAYQGDFHLFENTCDYTGINLKYEPYLPDLPVDITANATGGFVKLKNISDDLITDFDAYCGYYREGRQLFSDKLSIDRLMVYEDYKTYWYELPKEFYKVDEVRYYVWKNNQKPLSLALSKKVNTPYYPDGEMPSDVAPDSRYYAAIEDIYYSGIMLGYEDGTFHPEEPLTRMEATVPLCYLMGYRCHIYDFSCDDVPKSHWAKSYVGICVNEKVFQLEDNKFRPKDNITVNETLEAVSNIMKERNVEPDREKLLTNIDRENMDRDINRAEIAQIMHNYRNCM